MQEYVSKSSLGKVVVYSAGEFLESPYCDYVRRHVEKGFVVLVLPDEKTTTTRQSSYFFSDAKSEVDARESFLLKVGEDLEKEPWLRKLLKTIDFN